MLYCPLYSGSSGNCGYLEAGETRILVDCGLSGRVIEQAMESIGGSLQGIRGILISHEHSDHVKAAGILCRKYRIPIYANEATWQHMSAALGAVERSMTRIFATGEDFRIGDITVLPFPIPHDAAEPVGFRFWAGRRSVAIATDMGYVRQDVLDAVGGSDLILWESNHDVDMLEHNPHYTRALKQRILGRRGHLSNETSADGLLRLLDTGTHHIVLGHLSGENNTPELALETAVHALRRQGAEPGKDVFVDLAWRDRPGSVYQIR